MRCVLWVPGHALHVVLYAVLYAALYSGSRGEQSPFRGGARLKRYVLEAEKDVRHVL